MHFSGILLFQVMREVVWKVERTQPPEKKHTGTCSQILPGGCAAGTRCFFRGPFSAFCCWCSLPCMTQGIRLASRCCRRGASPCPKQSARHRSGSAD